MTTIRATSDPAEFKDRVFPFLRRDPVLHTALLSNVEGRILGAVHDPVPPVFLSVHQDGEVVGAVLATALRGIFSSRLDDAWLDPLIDALAARAAHVPYVEAMADQAEPFVPRFADRAGQRLVLDRRSRLHELGEFVPRTAPGRFRPATEADLPVVARLIATFGAETSGRLGPEEEGRWARTRIGLGQLWLWEDGGRVVAMAGHHGATFGADRIGPVCTDPVVRGRGYGTAVTAHLTRRILDSGARACLFTDLGNPTANKIYAGIGYRPVADFVRYALVSR